MKKLALTIVCAVAITGGVAFAQGTIAYTVISPAGFTVQTNANFYSPLFGGGATSTSGQGKTAITHAGFYYELLYNTALTRPKWLERQLHQIVMPLFLVQARLGWMLHLARPMLVH